MDTNPHIATAFERLGGVVATARALGLDHYQTAQNWLRTGNVPGVYAPRLEQLSGVSRRLLCKRWRALWPELAQAEPATRGDSHAQ